MLFECTRGGRLGVHWAKRAAVKRCFSMYLHVTSMLRVVRRGVAVWYWSDGDFSG